jgi:hypothetical protein
MALQKALYCHDLEYWQSYLRDLAFAKSCKSSPEREIPRWKQFLLPKLPKRERSNSCEFEAPSQPSPSKTRQRGDHRSISILVSDSSEESEDNEKITASKRVGPVTHVSPKETSRPQPLPKFRVNKPNTHGHKSSGESSFMSLKTAQTPFVAFGGSSQSVYDAPPSLDEDIEDISEVEDECECET